MSIDILMLKQFSLKDLERIRFCSVQSSPQLISYVINVSAGHGVMCSVLCLVYHFNLSLTCRSLLHLLELKRWVNKSRVLKSTVINPNKYNP